MSTPHSSFSIQDLSIPGPAGKLEARLTGSQGAPRFRCVVAHPHPLYGGTMENPTTRLLSERLAAAGGLVLRFQFRGVGESEGVHDHGRGEIEDLMAAERHLSELAPDLVSWLAGYSFGAAMILLRANRAGEEDTRPHRLLALAPPVSHYDLGFLERFEIPLSLICGDRDQLTPRGLIENKAASWPSLVRCHWLAGLAHDLGAGSADGGAVLARTLDRSINELC